MKGDAGRRGASRCGCRGSLQLCCRCDSVACPDTPLLPQILLRCLSEKSRRETESRWKGKRWHTQTRNMACLWGVETVKEWWVAWSQASVEQPLTNWAAVVVPTMPQIAKE